MIYARYRNRERSRAFVIDLMNTPKPKRGYTMVNATFHLENAIKKAFSSATPPEKVEINIDRNNMYLRELESTLVTYVKGLSSGMGGSIEII